MSSMCAIVVTPCTSRWKIECGKAWQLLEGEQSGQTQVGYSKISLSEPTVFNHPIDVHFAAAGLQVIVGFLFLFCEH